MGSRDKLSAVAHRLRLPNPLPESTRDEEVEESGGGKVSSRAGFGESALKSTAASVERGGAEERFRPRRAAVLVCLFEGEGGDFRVILTKRSSRLSIHSGLVKWMSSGSRMLGVHKIRDAAFVEYNRGVSKGLVISGFVSRTYGGEVSLPGGKAEEGDKDDGATATREAKEEIGLDPSLVNVVTCLEPFLSTHLLKVVPVIGILTDKEAFEPRLNHAEVEDIFDAPLEMFLKDENRTAQYGEFLGEKYLVHYFEYDVENKKFLIWGLTAAILIRAASVVYQRPPAFLEQNPAFKNNDETLQRYLFKSHGRM